jgi:hypothetical protein
MPRGSLHRSRVGRFGVPFAALALISAFLLLPLHAIVTPTHGAGGCALTSVDADSGSHPAEGPLHDPGDCPQCRALAQGRAALATAAPPQPVTAKAIGAPSLSAVDRLPHGPALAPEQPRAPPTPPPSRQA